MEKWYISGHAHSPCYIVLRIYIARGPWYFGDFCYIFLPNLGEDQEKVLPSESGAMALCHMVNPALVIASRS